LFKKDSKQITKWITDNEDNIIKLIETNGDISWKDIPVAPQNISEEQLVKNEYIKIKKETVVKGKKGVAILQFNDFYIEINEDELK